MARAVTARVNAHGIEACRATPEECAERKVEGFYWFKDPSASAMNRAGAGTGSKDVLVKDVFVPDYRTRLAEIEDDAEYGVVVSGFQEVDRVVEAQPHHQVFPRAFFGVDHLVSIGVVVVKRNGQCRVPVWTEQSPFLQS